MMRSKGNLMIIVFAAVLMFTGVAFSADPELTPPTPEKSPRLDEVCTSLRPVLAWVNSEGGVPPRSYVLQVDTSPSFKSPDLIEMNGIPEEVYVTVSKLPNSLKDNTRWFWRVKAVDSADKESAWSTECGGVTARFFVNTSMEKKLEYVRIPIRDVTSSCGFGTEYILDYDDENETYWEGAPNQPSHWVQFDLGEPKPVSRIFLVSGMAGWKHRLPTSVDWSSRSNLDGRLAALVWQYSQDGKTWIDIPETQRKNSDAFREIFDLDKKPVTARYFRLYIKAWHGRSPRIYDVILYMQGQPPVPKVPKGNYVLVIRPVVGFKPEAGTVKTDFGKMIRGLGGHVAPPWDLKVLELPAHAFSVDVLNQMDPRPVAIFLTGSPNWFCQVPHFEFSGQFDLTRTTDIPTYGACASHQLMMMAYEHTYARHTGRSYTTSEVKDIVEHDIPPIYIQKNDPIFAGLNNPFYGPEFHYWTVHIVEEGWEVLATSRDSKGLICNEMIKAIGRPVYGSQFHPEIAKPFSCSKGILMNFLAMAVERAKSLGIWLKD
jgi:GMP synthase-like glutamine amidotransferase